MNASAEKQESSLTRLLQLESMVRKTQSLKALQFLIVNESRRLLNYRQAYLFIHHKGPANFNKLEAASSVSIIDERSPSSQWLEDLLKIKFTESSIKSMQFMDANSCPEELRKNWPDFSMPYVVWCPLVLSDGTYVGGLWFGREKPWQENEHILIKSLCEIYAHGMAALEGPQFFKQPKQRGKVFVWSGIACILLILYFPLSLSTLAPSEIVPRDPSIVSAPINGVISEIYVSPNTYVEQGTLLFSYDDTELRNKFEVAEQAMSVSSVELRRATQGAFLDEESKSQVALLNAQLELRQAELDYASELLKQVDVYANESGLLIYTEESDWIGKPINVGEQVMQIADPENIRVKIDVPVGDAIILKEGAEVDVFLDVDPLNSLDARVTHTSYNAEPTTGDVLAYRVYADLDDESKDVRIGLQGTAKIYGHTVNLFFYLFRRPISSLRQFIGY